MVHKSASDQNKGHEFCTSSGGPMGPRHPEIQRKNFFSPFYMTVPDPPYANSNSDCSMFLFECLFSLVQQPLLSC